LPSDVPRSAAPPSLRRAAAPRPPAFPQDPLKPPRPAPDRRPIAVLAAAASLGAAAIHAAVVPEHDDWAPSAAFFGALATYQLLWGLTLLLRPVLPADLWVGAGANAAAVAVWLQSRTAGLPFGPHRGEAEPFARTDVLASVLGVTIVCAVLGMAARPRGLRMPRPRLASATATASVAVISAFALSGAAGHAHAPGEEPAGTHDTHTHVVPTVPRSGGEATPSAPRAVRKPVQTGSSSPPPVAAHDDGDGHVH
jgi:hypothetical protein